MPNEGKASKSSQSARSRSVQKRGGGFWDSEDSARYLLIGSIVALIVVAMGFIAFGWYWTEVRPERRTVLQVEDQKVSLAAMKRRMEYELFQSTALQQNPQTLADVAYENLANELTIIARADELGVALSDADFDSRLRTRVGASDTADARTVQDQLARQLDITGLKESEYRRLVQAEGLTEAIKDKFELDLPVTVEMASIEVIATGSQEEAQAAIDRINAGEAFADVAKDVSLETNVETTGGVQPYQPDGGFNPAYNDYAFSAPIGELSGPLSSSGSANVYVVRVIDRSEQQIREEQKPSLVEDKFDEWLTNTREELQSTGLLVNNFSDEDRSEALLAVYQGAVDEIAARQQAQLEAQQRQATIQAELTANPAPTQAPTTPGVTTPAAGSPAAEPTSQPEGAGPTPPSQPVVPENGQ